MNRQSDMGKEYLHRPVFSYLTIHMIHVIQGGDLSEARRSVGKGLHRIKGEVKETLRCENREEHPSDLVV